MSLLVFVVEKVDYLLMLVHNFHSILFNFASSIYLTRFTQQMLLAGSGSGSLFVCLPLRFLIMPPPGDRTSRLL